MCVGFWPLTDSGLSLLLACGFALFGGAVGFWVGRRYRIV